MNNLQQVREALVNALMFDPDPQYTMAIFSPAQAKAIVVEIELMIRLIAEPKEATDGK